MTDPFLDHLDAQRAGYKAGFVPFMGEWKQAFDLRPVSYSAGGAARTAFVQDVRDRLTNRFMFSRFIDVTITLQLDTQTVMESDAYATSTTTQNQSMTRSRDATACLSTTARSIA